MERGRVKEKGRVKWYDQEKNYGFIVSESGGEYFVHRTDVIDGTLEKGQFVQFEIGEGKKGPVAKNVQTIESEE
ncbi:MAG: cold shock domain-containing protein [Verrucomicrobia bacterium]|nr:cold shock domain-containing protein [Verrucomicrobiota bacterium]